jgi:hypothetical protein
MRRNIAHEIGRSWVVSGSAVNAPLECAKKRTEAQIMMILAPGFCSKPAEVLGVSVFVTIARLRSPLISVPSRVFCGICRADVRCKDKNTALLA